ncbi:hypothetical protein C7974DRAFT_385257 [Boeremia exigua]|uniref:uncharacterized protein n=1 Tax=Boeremia exigua TaxID=749465 RepID=UPI001E8EF250|nr:uncharacterized protein C7974DRAFT_385257 [Boeremia exigua]KAH6642334.1 hypothetical protein C7974DRAFT_385257 [Boeremia exigua]
MADSPAAHPASTTVPSADSPAAPTPANPTPSPRPHPTPLQKLRFLVARRLANAAHSTDRTLLRLAALLSTPSGIDVALGTTGYTLTLLAALGQRVLTHQLTAAATSLAEKAAPVMLPGESLVVQLPAPAHTTLLAQSVASSNAIAAVIADYRIFVRMFGLLGLYTWARATWRAPLPADAAPHERVLRGTTWAALASCVAFQVLENGAYAASKGMLTGAGWSGEVGKRRETVWWVWSSRFWAAYVGCEIFRLGVERACWAPKGKMEGEGDGEKEGKLQAEQEKREESSKRWAWWKDLASNVAYAPMTLHWSVEEGLLSELQVGAFGTVAAGALLVDAWRKTA